MDDTSDPGPLRHVALSGPSLECRVFKVPGWDREGPDLGPFMGLTLDREPAEVNTSQQDWWKVEG